MKKQSSLKPVCCFYIKAEVGSVLYILVFAYLLWLSYTVNILCDSLFFSCISVHQVCDDDELNA